MPYSSNKHAVMAQVRQAIFAQAKQAAQEIFTQSKAIVPIDDGELIGGAKIVMQETQDRLEIVIGYGTDPISAEYAVIQHENPFYNHTAGKRMKFLEEPFNIIAPRLLQEFRI